MTSSAGIHAFVAHTSFCLGRFRVGREKSTTRNSRKHPQHPPRTTCRRNNVGVVHWTTHTAISASPCRHLSLHLTSSTHPPPTTHHPLPSLPTHPVWLRDARPPLSTHQLEMADVEERAAVILHHQPSHPSARATDRGHDSWCESRGR